VQDTTGIAKEELVGLRLICGIDPGRKGAIVFLDIGARYVYIVDMPKFDYQVIEIFKEVCGKNYVDAVYIEKQHAFPRQGVVSTFNFGKHYGYLLGVLESLELRIIEVSPIKWKSYFQLKKLKTRKQIKQQSIAYAISLFPLLKDVIKNYDGRAEALLVAEFGRRHEFKS
jgi:crossover junction endodeoxyribonuclease RuvC